MISFNLEHNSNIFQINIMTSIYVHILYSHKNIKTLIDCKYNLFLKMWVAFTQYILYNIQLK